MNIFDFFQFLTGDIWLYAGSFILILSILVFVHEWGHYIIARAVGVRVDVFSIGFGRELIGFDDKHGTRWKFSLIPLGGYVQLFGDSDPASAKHDDAKKDKKTGKVRPFTKAELKVAFFNKPVWKRSAVVFAGPAINYIFAAILLTGLFTFNGESVTLPAAAAIVSGSAADEAGFEPHDRILEIDGKVINSFKEVRREMLISLDQKRHFVVERDGRVIDIYAAPEKVEVEDRFGFKHSKGLLGLIGPGYALKVKNIVKISGKSYGEDDLEQAISDLKNRLGTSFQIEIKNGKKQEIYDVNPFAEFNKNLVDQDSKEYGILFMSDKNSRTFVKHGFGEAFVISLVEIKDVTLGTFKALGQMITGSRSASELGGIIRIGALAGDMAQQGIVALIMFTALLSVNLGLINLFPIPLLDGGHLVFYAIEAISGRPVPDKFQEYAFQAGFVFLISLMAFANINDIIQLIL